VAPQPPSEPPVKAPSLRERWKEIPKGARIVIAGALLLIVIIIVAAASGGGSNTSSTTSRGGPTGNTVNPPPPPTPPVSLRLATGDYSMEGSRTTIQGTVTPGATVTVNGHAVPVRGTHWSKVVHLHFGPHTISVVATMAGHQSTDETITVTRDMAMTIDTGDYSTSESSTTLHGTVTPGAQVAVNSSSAGVEGSHWSKAVGLHLGGNSMVVEAKIGGQSMTQTITVTRYETPEQYKASAVTIPYNQLNKNPDEYVGKVVKYRGQIFQIQEEAGEGVMLLSVTQVYEDLWNDNIWVNYDKHINAAEKAIVTVYGEITGQKSYKTQIGGETYVPEMKAKYIEE
jgi:hypothetical protein